MDIEHKFLKGHTALCNECYIELKCTPYDD